MKPTAKTRVARVLAEANGNTKNCHRSTDCKMKPTAKTRVARVLAEADGNTKNCHRSADCN